MAYGLTVLDDAGVSPRGQGFIVARHGRTVFGDNPDRDKSIASFKDMTVEDQKRAMDEAVAYWKSKGWEI